MSAGFGFFLGLVVESLRLAFAASLFDVHMRYFALIVLHEGDRGVDDLEKEGGRRLGESLEFRLIG